MTELPVPAFDAVLVDLDGTLLHTAPELAHAANRMLAELGLAPVSEASIASFIGGGIRRTVQAALAGAMHVEVDAALLARGLAIFERAYAEEPGRCTTAYPGVVEGLARLASARMPLGIVTNKAGRFTPDLLARTGLAGYFGVVVCGDTLAVQKPAPEPLWHACARLGIAPEKTLFIGDSKHDVKAARAAGCAIWCVPYGYNEGDPVETLTCDRIVASVAAAATLICAA